VHSRQNYLHESQVVRHGHAEAVALPSENVFNGSLFEDVLLVFRRLTRGQLLLLKR